MGVLPARLYRTRLPLRIAVAFAAVLWGAVLALLVRWGSGDLRLLGGAAGFSAFFLAFTFVYRKTWIAVTEDGIVASTPFRVRPVPFDEILEIVVRDGLGLREYAVRTRRGRVMFTSLLARHGELFELLRERAGLEPR
jgi:hypothetical protein